MTNYYLIDDIYNIMKGRVLFDNNNKIKVKDVPNKIRVELNNELVEKDHKEIFEKIVTSHGYKLVLVNSI